MGSSGAPRSARIARTKRSSARRKVVASMPFFASVSKPWKSSARRRQSGCSARTLRVSADEVVVEIVARVPAVVPEARPADRAGDEDDLVARPLREEVLGEALGDEEGPAVALGRRRSRPPARRAAVLRDEAHRLGPGRRAVGVGAAHHVALAGERKDPGRHRVPRHHGEGQHAGRVAEALDGVERLALVLDEEQPVGVLRRVAVGPDPPARLRVAPVLGEHLRRHREGDVADAPGSSVTCRWPSRSSSRGTRSSQTMS